MVKTSSRDGLAARSIALVTDFVVASLPIEAHVVGRKGAQEVVHARLVQLAHNLQIAIAAIAGKTPQRPRPAGNTELP